MRNLRPSLLLLFVHAAFFAIDVCGVELDKVFKQTLDAMQPAFDIAEKEGQEALEMFRPMLRGHGTLPEEGEPLEQKFWRLLQELGYTHVFLTNNKAFIDRDLQRLQLSLLIVKVQERFFPEGIFDKITALYLKELSTTYNKFPWGWYPGDILGRTYVKADGFINNLAWSSQDMHPIAYLMAHKAIAHDKTFAQLLRDGQLSTTMILDAARAATMLDESTFPMFWSLRSSNLFYTLHGIGDPPEAAKRLQSLLLHRFVRRCTQEVKDLSMSTMLHSKNAPSLSPIELEKVIAVAGSVKQRLTYKEFRAATVQAFKSNKPVPELDWPTKEEALSLSKTSVVFVNEDHWTKPVMTFGPVIGDSRHWTYSQRRRSFGHP